MSSIDSGFLIAEEYEQLQPKVGGKPKQFYNREGTDAVRHLAGVTCAKGFSTFWALSLFFVVQSEFETPEGAFSMNKSVMNH